MRLAIYVPKAQADRWSPEGMSFDQFQRAVVNLTGGITVTQATGHWTGSRDGYVQEPVFVVETLASQDTASPFFINPDRYERMWVLLRQYAWQLIAQGEESVLIVQDNEPTLIA